MDSRNFASLYVFARKIDQFGSSSLIHEAKSKLTQQLGVHLPDLRVLNSSLACSYPSALFCRDRALRVNLEDINCIITGFVLFKATENSTHLSVAAKLQGHYAPQVGKELTAEVKDNFCQNPFELRVLDVVLDLVGTELLYRLGTAVLLCPLVTAAASAACTLLRGSATLILPGLYCHLNLKAWRYSDHLT
jgi:hypothetical protein